MLDHIRALQRSHPGLFQLLRQVGRAGIRAYWLVREVAEVIGNWLSDVVFRPVRRALASAGLTLQAIPPKIECMLSFLGLLPRLRGETDPSLIVMVAFSDLTHDPRIEREARALAAAGYQVVVVSPTVGNDIERDIDWGPSVTIDIAPIYASRFVFRWPGFLGDRLFKSLLAYRPLAIHAHDLNMAFIAFAAGRRTGAKVVVDFHEWYSENVSFDVKSGRYVALNRRWQGGYRWLERYCLANADLVVTVCDSIAEAMAKELGNGRKPEVIRNIPAIGLDPTRVYLPLKQALGLPPHQFLLLYQGGLGPSRMIEPVIEALAHTPGCALLVRGPQMEKYERDYRAIAEVGGYSERLFLQGAVPSRDVVVAARGADAGIYTVLGVGRNFIYALPNKIFEYLAAGLPVLVADYPEAKRVVEQHEVGLAFDPQAPLSIAAAINRLVEDGPLRERMTVNTALALAEMDAEREWSRLADSYRRLSQSEAGRVIV